MTTIAYKDGIVAVDGMCRSYNEPIDNEYQKYREIQGEIYLVAGDASFLSGLKEWIKNEYAMDAIAPDSGVVRIMRANKVCFYDAESHSAILCNDNFAFGSGQYYAQGAMMAGATAAEAVRIASKFDVYTNDNVTQIDVRTLTIL